jgi:hypothetical protein
MKSWRIGRKNLKLVSNALPLSDPSDCLEIFRLTVSVESTRDESVKVQFRDLRDEGKALQQEATNALDGADEEIIQEVQRRRQEDTPDLEQLEGERDEINAKLDCMISVSDAVVEAYKKRKGEVSFRTPLLSLSRLTSLKK